MPQNKNLSKKFAPLASIAVSVPISLHFVKNSLLRQNLHYFTGKAWELK
jgi:hypothetical protein